MRKVPERDEATAPSDASARFESRGPRWDEPFGPGTVLVCCSMAWTLKSYGIIPEQLQR